MRIHPLSGPEVTLIIIILLTFQQPFGTAILIMIPRGITLIHTVDIRPCARWVFLICAKAVILHSLIALLVYPPLVVFLESLAGEPVHDETAAPREQRSQLDFVGVFLLAMLSYVSVQELHKNSS